MKRNTSPYKIEYRKKRIPDVPRGIRYSGKYFNDNGVSYPMEAVSTERLIQELNRLRGIERKSTLEKQQMRHLDFIITWRNRNELTLPKELRYNPHKWSLSEITEYNYPECIYELSILYDLALRQGSLGKINLLHDILYQKGWVYYPARYKGCDVFPDGSSEEIWDSPYIEPSGINYNKRDLAILKARGLLK